MPAGDDLTPDEQNMQREGLMPKGARKAALQMGLVPIAVRRTVESLDEARFLLEDGHPSASLVWAVRSAEIFFKEVLLFPLFYEQEGDVEAAFKRVRETFASGKWKQSLQRIRDSYGLHGPDHEMLTEDDSDAWAEWLRHYVGLRGDVVHGRCEAPPDLAQGAIDFADRMREWFTIRVLMSDEGPLAHTLQDLIADARLAYERAKEEGLADSAESPDD